MTTGSQSEGKVHLSAITTVLTERGLLHDTVAVELDTVIDSVVMHSDVGAAPPQRALVLAPGVTDVSAINELARQCSLQGSIVAVRPKGDSRSTSDLIIHLSTVDAPALLLHPEASWHEVLELAWARLPPARGTPPGIHGAKDFFEIADLAAEAVGGATTIEDEEGRLVGYSQDQRGGDEIRVSTIVSRREPDRFAEAMRRSGTERLLRQSDQPIRVRDLLPGASPRVALGLRDHNGVFLGALWATVPEMTEAAERAFRSLGGEATLHFLQRRSDSERTRAIELEKLAVLLHGGSTSSISEMLPPGRSCVAVVEALATEPAKRAALEARVDQRISRQSLGPLNVLWGQLSGMRYLILTATSRSSGEGGFRNWLGELVTRSSDGNPLGVRVGLGRWSDEPGDLPRSRREAEYALMVARRRHTSEVVTFTECWAEAILLRLLDSPARADLEALSPLHQITDYDARHETNYLATISEWLRCQGNVRQAAKALDLHPNTLRYRLERFRELFNIDLDNPDVRLVLDLHMRI